MSIHIGDAMIIGVVGLNGAGKDTVAKYAVEKYGFVHKDLGQEIRDMLKENGKDHLDRGLMIALGNEMRQKNGFNYWCKRAISAANSGNVIITSVRNPSEADEIKSSGGKIVEVFANQKLRFERTQERVRNNPGSHGDIQSFEKFIEMEKRELESADPSKQQLIACIELADYRLNNNGTFEMLYGEIDGLMPKLK